MFVCPCCAGGSNPNSAIGKRKGMLLSSGSPCRRFTDAPSLRGPVSRVRRFSVSPSGPEALPGRGPIPRFTDALMAMRHIPHLPFPPGRVPPRRGFRPGLRPRGGSAPEGGMALSPSQLPARRALQPGGRRLRAGGRIPHLDERSSDVSLKASQVNAGKAVPRYGTLRRARSMN